MKDDNEEEIRFLEEENQGVSKKGGRVGNQDGFLEEDVEMDGDEEKQDQNEKPSAVDDVNVAVESNLQAEMDRFLNSASERCILYPNVAREHMKMVIETII